MALLTDYVSSVTQTLKVIIFTPRRASFRQKFREMVQGYQRFLTPRPRAGFAVSGRARLRAVEKLRRERTYFSYSTLSTSLSGVRIMVRSWSLYRVRKS